MSIKRGENFSGEQKEYIINFIQTNRLLESKKASVSVFSAKQKLWTRLVNSFNSEYTSNKTLKQMKVFWKQQKSKTKKVVANQRKEAFKTGGGSNSAAPLTADQEQIVAIIATDLNPLTNEFDDDAMSQSASEISCDEPEKENAPKSTKKASKRQPSSQDFFEISEKRLRIEERKTIAQERIANVGF